VHKLNLDFEGAFEGDGLCIAFSEDEQVLLVSDLLGELLALWPQTVRPVKQREIRQKHTKKGKTRKHGWLSWGMVALSSFNVLIDQSRHGIQTHFKWVSLKLKLTFRR
jgi:hypothetical protein